MSCGQIALKKLNIKVDKYFASEIDKYAMKVTNLNFPETIQLGDINNYEQWDLPKIDLMMGGSSCQDFSQINVGKGKAKGLDGEKSKLFYRYVECLHKFKPKYFFLENVEMKKEEQDIITSILGVEPIAISSKLFSAQDRPRLYWTNIPFDGRLPENNSVLKDVMETDVDEKYFYDDPFIFHGENKRVMATLQKKLFESIKRVYNPEFKAPTLTAVCGGHHHIKVFDKGRPRKLTPLEYERLQTVPDEYTASVSDSQRYRMLGNGWTISVISHLLSQIK